MLELKKSFYWSIFILIFFGFIFLRFYKIQSNLNFFGDMGRDFLELLDWQESLIPPLLGPQTSVIAINQSPIYYYLLFPFFLLFRHSIYSTLIANCFYYLLCFTVLFIYFLKKNSKNIYPLLSVFFLISIHPQFILQHRYIWNPSLLGIFILLSFYAYLALIKKFNNLGLMIFSWSITGAVALNYSVLPLLAAYLILAFFEYRKKFVKVALSIILSFFILYLPTIFFEIRHHFILSKMLFNRPMLDQGDVTLFNKFKTLASHLTSQNFTLASIILLLTIIILIIILVFNFQKKIILRQELIMAIKLFLLTTVIFMLLPIGVASHYIFAPLVLLMIIVSYSTRKLLLPLLLLISFVFLNKKQVQSYFQALPRTAEETLECAKLICEKYSEPIFVSLNSKSHDHSAKEHRFFMHEQGCQVKDISQGQDQANLMVVVLDNSSYVHKETAYNELTQFGLCEEIQQITCQADLSYVILKKLP